MPHPFSNFAQVDPNRTISAGKVDIGAFRTYPENYTPPNVSASEYQSIPLNKIEDFGVHANQYYQLDVQIFTSSLDTHLLGLLWNKYWVNTLSQSPLISVRLVLGLSSRRILRLSASEPSICGVTTERYASKTFQGSVVSQQHSRTGTDTQGRQRADEGLDHYFCLAPSHRSIVQDEKEKKKEENQLTKSVRDR